MTRNEIEVALRHLKVETGSLACMGCGREHNCGTSGCQIMRCAADLLENDESHAIAMQRELKRMRARLDWETACADRIRRQNQELRDAAALVTKLAGDAAVEREWIPVTERLPEPGVDVLAAYRDRHINMGTAGDDWLEEDIEDGYITHWMPLPEPPEVE